MRNLIVPATLVVVLSLTAGAFAASDLATSSRPVGTQTTIPSAALASTEIGCTELGSEVSVLIDVHITSPNISAVRAAFERGVADCMESDTKNANKHYQEAKNLLGSD